MTVFHSLEHVKWRFPEIGIPPNHPFIEGFSFIKHLFWGSPILGNPHFYAIDVSTLNFANLAILDEALQSCGYSYRALTQRCSDNEVLLGWKVLVILRTSGDFKT